MISKDKNDKYNEIIGLIEYLASYINPEGVKRVQEARKNTSFVPDDHFVKVIEKLIGKDAAKEAIEKNNG
jgi:hypothetical protein